VVPFLNTLIYPCFFPEIAPICEVFGSLLISSAVIPDFFDDAYKVSFWNFSKTSAAAFLSFYSVNTLSIPSEHPA
jgi:hypothetical protein